MVLLLEEYLKKLVGKIILPKKKDELLRLCFNEHFHFIYNQKDLKITKNLLKLEFKDNTYWYIDLYEKIIYSY